MTTAQTDKIERARTHLATCMERDDFPSHNCACDCGDVSELLAEVARLQALVDHDTQVMNDQTMGSYAVLAENERLRAFVQKVSLYSNDSWLAREADALAPGATLDKS